MFQILAPLHSPDRRNPASARRSTRFYPRASRREVACRGQGLEFAHLQIRFVDVTLTIAYRLRADGFIIIENGPGDERQAAWIITATQLRRAEARAAGPGRR